jgi:hypothetical protein
MHQIELRSNFVFFSSKNFFAICMNVFVLKGLPKVKNVIRKLHEILEEGNKTK